MPSPGRTLKWFPCRGHESFGKAPGGECSCARRGMQLPPAALRWTRLRDGSEGVPCRAMDRVRPPNSFIPCGLWFSAFVASWIRGSLLCQSISAPSPPSRWFTIPRPPQVSFFHAAVLVDPGARACLQRAHGRLCGCHGEWEMKNISGHRILTSLKNKTGG